MGSVKSIVDPLYCSWDTTSTYLLFSDNVFGNFIYYSHLLPIICLGALSLVLLIKSPKEASVRWFVFIALAFTAWSLSDLVLWATANPSHTMFFWSIIIHFELLVYIGALYFIYNFITDKSVPVKYELLLFFLYIPIVLFAHTSLNLTSYDYTNCWREALEGPLLTYAYSLEIFIALWILVYGFVASYKKQNKGKREIQLATLGTVFFLISFSLGNIIGTLEVDWVLGQYGLFGIPVFVGLLAYLIIKYKSFNAGLLGAQALMIGIFVLVVSILFIRRIEYVRSITLITSLSVAVLGFFLIKTVKKEIKQKEEIEILASNLERANNKLKELDKQKSEFVSIASHQLRSPLTAIRGYASMMAEGSFGKLPDKAQESAERIAHSAKLMATAVEDYLNVSRIESGNMKYSVSDFNLKREIEHITDDLRTEAIKKGLILIFRTDLKSQGIISADIGKTVQIVHNLINNSIKYTPKGTINVFLRDDIKLKKVYLDITDTGIGMSEETQRTIFQKFERAKDANTVNVSGTGLGLFVALKMAVAMGGNITATSEGSGKGSRFTLEMPLAL